ncbi:hypothetical protein GWK47_011421 [Chionoecetes opilio]|uniref:Uncharacterized protein n=1 Tax=Chionoecetes opilio TaxID=41210 RepID=A0A8J5CPV8_CHIOP|nr:hypothetical protein GWK47_011421 [Chionoecetes opilio]
MVSPVKHLLGAPQNQKDYHRKKGLSGEIKAKELGFPPTDAPGTLVKPAPCPSPDAQPFPRKQYPMTPGNPQHPWRTWRWQQRRSTLTRREEKPGPLRGKKKWMVDLRSTIKANQARAGGALRERRGTPSHTAARFWRQKQRGLRVGPLQGPGSRGARQFGGVPFPWEGVAQSLHNFFEPSGGIFLNSGRPLVFFTELHQENKTSRPCPGLLLSLKHPYARGPPSPLSRLLLRLSKM